MRTVRWGSKEDKIYTEYDIAVPKRTASVVSEIEHYYIVQLKA